MSSVNLTFFGQTETLTIPGNVATYPYPVVKWSTRATNETVQHFIFRFTTPTIIDFEGQPASFNDFAQGAWNHSATDNGGWGLLGNYVIGFINANLSMVPGSSTKAALVNALPNGATANYQLARLGRGANPNVPLPAYFTGALTGTAQGHQYHGLQTYTTDKAMIGPALFKGIVGKAGGVPPWETFAYESFHDTNPTYNNVEIDGQSGAGVVTATGMGFASTDRAGVFTHNGTYVHDITGGAISHYMMTNNTFVFNDGHFKNTGGAALNFEQSAGSNITVNRPTFENSAKDMVLDSTNGFTTVVINDPVLTAAHPKVNIVCHSVYSYNLPKVMPNLQIDSATNNHVTLNVNGQSRPDLIRFLAS